MIACILTGAPNYSAGFRSGVTVWGSQPCNRYHGQMTFYRVNMHYTSQISNAKYGTLFVLSPLTLVSFALP